MANDDRRSEQFIREVDEEYRRAQVGALWDRFGWLVIAVCILVVLVTAGYRGWAWWQHREAAQYGDVYLAAIEKLEGEQRDEGIAELNALIEDGSAGYALLARLQLAATQSEAGQTAEAIASFDAITADENAPDPVRALARVRAALIALDTGDLDGAIARAEPLAVAGEPWRHVAREVIGTARYQKGELDAARQSFAAIEEDAEASASLRERAGMMIALLDSQAAPAPAEPAGAAATEGQTTNEPDGAPAPGQ